MLQDGLVSWRELLSAHMRYKGESFSDIVSCTLTDEELDVEFDAGYGGIEGKSFTVWTHNRVYFPWCYDGSEGVASVSRNPDGKRTAHIGG